MLLPPLVDLSIEVLIRGELGFRVTKERVSRKLKPASGGKKLNLTGIVEKKSPVQPL
jgi:hypothetical protein